MQKFQTFTSTCCPIKIKDVDTDMIIPAQYMTSVSKEGYGENLFRRLRDNDKNFPLNLEKYKNSQIIIADDNFGCGSSREHAVWALMSWGIKAIIAKSFADIFASNSAKSGLLLITLAPEKVDNLLDAASSAEGLTIDVDLKNQKLTTDKNDVINFDYNPFRKHCLINGLDDLDYILSKRDEISAFRDKQQRSVV